MKYIKLFREFFYYDGGPYYGSAVDPSIPSGKELALREYIYSNIQSKYFTKSDIEDLLNQYFIKYQKKTKISNTAELDNVIKLIYSK